MGMNALFRAMAALLFQGRAFWDGFRAGQWPVGREAFRAYAVPVIAMVQVLRFPLIGEPRPAMFLAISTFIIDFAALQVAAGAAARLLRPDAGGADPDAPAVVAYAMTPVWIAGLFAFTGPLWPGAAVLAVAWSLLAAARGFSLAGAVPAARLRAVLAILALIEALSLFSGTAALRVFNP